MAATPLPANLARALAALRKNLGISLANYDVADQNTRRSYKDKRHSIDLGKIQSLRSAAISAADRGLTQSGIHLNAATEVNKAAGQSLNAASSQMTSSLADIAKKRLQAQSDYNKRKAELEQEATGSITPVGGFKPKIPKPVVAAPVSATPKPPRPVQPKVPTKKPLPTKQKLTAGVA